MTRAVTGRQLIPALVLSVAGGLVSLRYAEVASPHPLMLAAGMAGWLVLFTAATLGGGAVAVRLVTRRAARTIDDHVISAAVGAALLAALAGALGLVGLLSPVPLVAILAGLAILGARPLLAVVRAGSSSLERAPHFPALLLAGCGLVTLLAAGTTAPFYDQFHYHLALPERWLAAGSVEIVPRQSYSYFPANMGLMYTYALAGPGVWGAQVIHWWFAALGTLAAGRLARRCGGSVRSAWWAAALFAATPSVLMMSSWAAADLGVAGFGAASLLALFGARGRASERSRRGGLLLSGLLAGAAFGSKYLALATVAIPLAATAIAIRFASSAGRRARGAAAGAALIACGVSLAFAPWGIRNLVVAGNPVHPFFAEQLLEVAPTEAIRDAAATAGGITSDPRGVERLSAIASLRTFTPKGEAGEIGPAWLALLAGWIAALVFCPRVRSTWPLALAALSGVALWAQFPQLGRYLVPVLVPAAAGAAVAWDSIARHSTRLTAYALSGLLGFLVLWSAHGGIDDLTLDRIACSMGRQDTETFLSKWVSYWPAVESIATSVPENGKLLLVAESRTLMMPRNVVVEDPFHRPWVEELAESSDAPAGVAKTLSTAGVTHVLFNRHEAERIAKLNGRTHYFEPRTPRAGENLQRFFGECLERVSQDGPVTIYSLEPECGNGSRRPGESIRPASNAR